MKLWAVILAVSALSGCYADPVRKGNSNNPEVQIEELFTHRGVTVYRFHDAGRAVYFTSRGDTELSRMNGKVRRRQQTLNGAW
jgi:hypothetical protein